MRLFLVAAAIILGSGLVRAEPLQDIKVLSDRAPDCSSLQAIFQSVTRGCNTDDEKMIAIYNHQRYVYYHYACPTEEGGVSALKLIHAYGWGLCGGLHTVMASIWDAAGYKYRYRGWSSPGHTTVEVFYGDRWHWLDTFLKFYCWAPDPKAPGGRTIASQEDIRANPALVTEQFVMDQTRKVWYCKDDQLAYVGERVNWTAMPFLVCGDDIPGLLSGVRSSNNAGSPRGWGAIKFDDPNYSTAVNLAPGYSLTLDWARVPDAWYHRGAKQHPRHTCGDKDIRNCPAIGPLLEPYLNQGPRSWENGTLSFRPDMRNDAFLRSFKHTENLAWQNGKLTPQDPAKPAVAVVEMSSPYIAVLTKAEAEGDDVKIEYSADQKTWKPTQSGTNIDELKGKYTYWVRFTFTKPVAQLAVVSIVQHNQEALPYLAPGKNTITVTAANPAALGSNRLVVTYAYCPGWRNATPEQLFDRGAEVARAHSAEWSAQPIVVQKVIDKLPCTFEIVVPTPKGKQPVYPRMLFLRREVLAPGQEPLPVPAPPSIPAVGPNEELATLPNPWTIGTRPPPKMPQRPTTSTTYAPAKVGYVSKQGQTFSHQFVKWLKDNSDAWILLVAFDLKQLPEPKQLASAKLAIYVHEAHDKAPMQVAAVMLDAPFEPGKPYDFANLGRMLGSTIVDRGDPNKAFDPPKRYELDVTQAVRAWAQGHPNHGLAVRIVPNRSVDDGWTVRFTPNRQKPAELQIELYEQQ